MKKTHLVLTAIIFSAAVLSCSKDTYKSASDWSADDITGEYTKIWKMTACSVDGTNEEIPVWAADDVLILNHDGTGFLWFGEVKRYPADTLKVDEINWHLEKGIFTFSNLDILQDPDGDGRQITTVLELSENVLRYEYLNNNSDKVEIRYEPVVHPSTSPSQRNKALTNGNARFWKIAKVWRDGEPYQIPQWRKDDLFLFCTDGTGYFTTGAMSQFPGDSTTNDFFHWGFAEKGAKIDIEQFEHGDYNVSDCNIIELSDDAFVYQGELSFDGELHTWKMKRVPLLK